MSQNRTVSGRRRTTAGANSATTANGRVPDAVVPSPFSDTAGGMLLGYARVSRGDHQTLDSQLDALKRAGCARIFADKMSGARDDRPELARLLDVARAGDVLVVAKLDRLGRSVKHLVGIVAELEERGIRFRSLGESWDTATPMGRFCLHLLMSLAELERGIIRERTMAGLAAARERGRVGGRPRALDARKTAQLRELMANETSIATAARTVGVGRATVYRWLSATQPDS